MELVHHSEVQIETVKGIRVRRQGLDDSVAGRLDLNPLHIEALAKRFAALYAPTYLVKHLTRLVTLGGCSNQLRGAIAV